MYRKQLTPDGVLMCREDGDRLRSDGGVQQPGLVMIESLSKREGDVLSCLQKGLSNKEIGLVLGISPRTVQKHLQRVYQRLGVESRVEAVVIMQRLGMSDIV